MVKKEISEKEAEEIFAERERLKKVPLSQLLPQAQPRVYSASDYLSEISSPRYRREETKRKIKTLSKRLTPNKLKMPSDKKIKGAVTGILGALMPSQAQVSRPKIDRKKLEIARLKKQLYSMRQREADALAEAQRQRYEQFDSFDESPDMMHEQRMAELEQRNSSSPIYHSRPKLNIMNSLVNGISALNRPILGGRSYKNSFYFHETPPNILAQRSIFMQGGRGNPSGRVELMGSERTNRPAPQLDFTGSRNPIKILTPTSQTGASDGNLVNSRYKVKW